MADDQIKFKISFDPLEEMDDKKWKMMAAKEIGLKKPKPIVLTCDFTVTSAKWNEKRLKAQLEAIMRYDLSLFASQVWQDFDKIKKIKKEPAKKKAITEFTKNQVKNLQKSLEKRMKEKLEDFEEDIASGASDDLGALKGARKGLNASAGKKITYKIEQVAERFEERFKLLKGLKDAETRGSGDEKAKAGKELEKEIASSIPLLAKQLEGLIKGITKELGPVLATPSNMRKSIKKDMSDAAKAEYKKSSAELEKVLKDVLTALGAAKKNVIDALSKMKRKDFSSGVKALAESSLNKLDDSAGKLSDTMKDIDGKLKTLEQAAKKR